MKKITREYRKLFNKVIVFIMTAAAVCFSMPGIPPCTVYAGYRCGIFSVSLSDQGKMVKSVKARIVVDDYVAYKKLLERTNVIYCWDSELKDPTQNTGTEYVITTPGQHTLSIYTSADNGKYGSVAFGVGNIDSAKPVMGDIKAVKKEEGWELTLDGCSDPDRPDATLDFLCLKKEETEDLRSAGRIDEDRVAAHEGWKSDAVFPVEGEGVFCIFAKDEAGNVSEKQFDTGSFDLEPPSFLSDPAISYEGEINGFARAALISVEAEDNGMEPTGYPYSFNDGATWQQGRELRVMENGTVTIRLKDESGNISEAKTVEITNLDNESPSLSLSAEESSSNDGTTRVSVAAADRLSGVSEISYQNDEVGVPVILAGGNGSGSGRLDAVATINSNGSYTFIAKDVLGNTAYEKINVVRSVHTEYRDRSEKNDKEKDKDKNKDKNKEKKDNSSGSGSGNKETKVISPGNGSGSGSAGGGNNGSQAESGDNKIVIKDADGVTSGAGTKGADGKDTEKDKNGTKEKNSGNSELKGSGSIKSGRGTSYTVMNRYQDQDEDLSDNENEDDEDDEDTESTEIREVTLDEYLSGAPNGNVSEEEVIPELEEDENDGKDKKNDQSGKIAMIVLILLILTGLTVFLLIKKGIISLPDPEEDDMDDNDEETGVLGIGNFFRGLFKKNTT